MMFTHVLLGRIIDTLYRVEFLNRTSTCAVMYDRQRSNLASYLWSFPGLLPPIHTETQSAHKEKGLFSGLQYR
jgi:hypothetical protein